MRSFVTPRLALAAIALLLYSAGAAAECTRPVWPDPVPLKPITSEARFGFLSAYQTRVHEFIVCQRGSLEKRVRGRTSTEVQQLILQDRVTEERVLAEVDRLDSCMAAARREPDPAVVRKTCEDNIEAALRDRRPPGQPFYEELKNEQRSLYGGVLSHATLDYGRAGACDDAECDKLLGVQVTNLTPVVLRCEVTLAVSHPQDGMHRGEQVITLNPGDSLPSARVRIRNSPERFEPGVMCSPATPLAAESRVPAACVLNWSPRGFRHSSSSTNHSWWSGTALLELSAGRGHKPPEAIRMVGEDSPGVGQLAQALVEKLPVSTNCPGQRFRVRVEYRSFPCHVCEGETGVVTMYRDDRVLR